MAHPIHPDPEKPRHSRGFFLSVHTTQRSPRRRESPVFREKFRLAQSSSPPSLLALFPTPLKFDPPPLAGPERRKSQKTGTVVAQQKIIQ
jgi:hypothetical protein